MEKNDEYYIRLALKEALKSKKTNDVPVGCIIVKDNEIIARAHNEKEKKKIATEHAEIIAIRKASKKIGHWRLHKCKIYVTLEPCSMCASALINARIEEIIFGAFDKERGALGSKLDLPLFNLECVPKVRGGILKDDCSKLLSDFFKQLRMNLNKE